MPSADYIEIFRGETRNFTLILKDKNGDRYSLANVTVAQVDFEKEDGSTLSLLSSGGSPPVVIASPTSNGKITVLVSATDSALLKKKDRQDFTLKLTYADASIRYLKIRDRLTVSDPAP